MRDTVNEEGVREITESMAALNGRASEIMVEAGASTATDITGFGLIGHIYEVLRASKLRARLYSGRVPYFEDAVRLAEKNVVPGGTVANFRIFSPYVRFAPGVPDHERILMNDAQTSGGLVIFVPRERKDALVGKLRAEGIGAEHIGDATDEQVSDEEQVLMYVER
jgi:selenide,water dikinase